MLPFWLVALFYKKLNVDFRYIAEERKELIQFRPHSLERKHETDPDGFWKKKMEFEKDETFAIWTSVFGIGEGGHNKIMFPQMNS